MQLIEAGASGMCSQAGAWERVRMYSQAGAWEQGRGGSDGSQETSSSRAFKLQT